MKDFIILLLVLGTASLTSAELQLSYDAGGSLQVIGNDSVYVTYTRFVVVTEAVVSGWTIEYLGEGTTVTDFSGNSTYVDMFQAKIDLFTSCETVTHVFKIEIKDTDPTIIDITNGILIDFSVTGAVWAYLTDDSDGTLTAQSCQARMLIDPSCTCEELYRDSPLYDRYVAAGKDPSCWCWQYQCRGDADNSAGDELWGWSYRIYDADLTALSNNWKKTPETGAYPCADFDHIEEEVFIEGFYSIYDGDLTILANNWKKADDELSSCPTYLP